MLARKTFLAHSRKFAREMQKFRKFFSSRKFLLAKVSAPKVTSLWKWSSHKTEFLLNLNVFMSCPILILCSHCCALFRSVTFLGSGILKKLLPFVVLPVVFVHLYAWQVGILINANINCEIMKCDTHQHQITNKLITCITEAKN